MRAGPASHGHIAIRLTPPLPAARPPFPLPFPSAPPPLDTHARAHAVLHTHTPPPPAPGRAAQMATAEAGVSALELSLVNPSTATPTHFVLHPGPLPSVQWSLMARQAGIAQVPSVIRPVGLLYNGPAGERGGGPLGGRACCQRAERARTPCPCVRACVACVLRARPAGGSPGASSSLCYLRNPARRPWPPLPPFHPPHPPLGFHPKPLPSCVWPPHPPPHPAPPTPLLGPPPPHYACVCSSSLPPPRPCQACA